MASPEPDSGAGVEVYAAPVLKLHESGYTAHGDAQLRQERRLTDQHNEDERTLKITQSKKK